VAPVCSTAADALLLQLPLLQLLLLLLPDRLSIQNGSS
jgi:hypothetical protein